MNKEMNLTNNVLEKFNLQGQPNFLPGGEGRTYKVNDAVLKHVSKDSAEYTNWIANLFDNIEENGFRTPKPLRSTDGAWITDDGWTAWSFIEGNHDYEGKIPESISAIKAFHEAIKSFPRPDFLDEDNPYHRADKYAWGEKPQYIHPELKEIVDKLYELRKPVLNLSDQLMHGDLNPDNILISDQMPPGIIDIAPYWRPAEFALAIYAFWIGPWKGKPEVLDYFKDVKEFDQLLVRAGIRMLLIKSESGNITDVDKCKTAAETIKQFVERKH